MPEARKPATCEKECSCTSPHDATELIVITGGPGAGKTAVLEVIRKQLCEHVVILPEAASIIFGGGFWRLDSPTARLASQTAIMHVQQQIEKLVMGEKKWALGLCDRGLLDGLAYWPGEPSAFWTEARTTLDAEYKRYHAVIHLRTPTDALGYNHMNPLRTETAAQAHVIDEKIAAIWSGHPRYRTVESTPDFLAKAHKALEYIVKDMPRCCAGILENGKR
jgi:predicted ATPase